MRISTGSNALKLVKMMNIQENEFNNFTRENKYNSTQYQIRD